MKDKKTIIFFSSIILCIIIVIVLACAVVNFVSGSKKSKNKNVYKDAKITSEDTISKQDREYINKYDVFQKNAYYNTLDTETKKNNIKIIDEILSYINQKEFDKLYSVIDENYIGYKFKSKEEYTKYITDITAGATDYTCDYYDVRSQGVVCSLISNTSGEDIFILINYISVDENIYTIYLDGNIKEIIAHDDYLTRVDEILMFTHKYTAKYISKEGYLFEIKNISKKDMTVSIDKVQKQYMDRGIECYLDGLCSAKEITLAPGKTEKIEFIFDDNQKIVDTSSNVKVNFKINDKEYEKLMAIEYSFLEDY